MSKEDQVAEGAFTQMWFVNSGWKILCTEITQTEQSKMSPYFSLPQCQIPSYLFEYYNKEINNFKVVRTVETPVSTILYLP